MTNMNTLYYSENQGNKLTFMKKNTFHKSNPYLQHAIGAILPIFLFKIRRNKRGYQTFECVKLELGGIKD